MSDFLVAVGALTIVVVSLGLMVLVIQAIRSRQHERQRLREVIEQARRVAALGAERRRRDLLRRELRAAMQIGKCANGVPERSERSQMHDNHRRQP